MSGYEYGFEFFNFVHLYSTFTKRFEVIDTNIDSDSGHDFMQHSKLQTEIGINDFPSEKTFDSTG